MSDLFHEQAGARAGETGAVSGHRQVLTGRAAADDVHRRQLRTVKLCDIAYMDHIGKSKPGHLYRECFDLAGPHRNDAVVNGGQRESPDPVKQAAHRRRKFRIVHFRADTKIHSLRCASSPHTSRGIGLVRGPHAVCSHLATA